MKGCEYAQAGGELLMLFSGDWPLSGQASVEGERRPKLSSVGSGTQNWLLVVCAWAVQQPH
jgi:hypothetical protein